MGRFPVNNLMGGAKIEGGRLVLGTDEATLVAANRSISEFETPAMPANPPATWVTYHLASRAGHRDSRRSELRLLLERRIPSALHLSRQRHPFRPRLEYRHGALALAPDHAHPASDGARHVQRHGILHQGGPAGDYLSRTRIGQKSTRFRARRQSRKMDQALSPRAENPARPGCQQNRQLGSRLLARRRHLLCPLGRQSRQRQAADAIPIGEPQGLGLSRAVSEQGHAGCEEQ